jgi:hypothetical protein
MLNLTGDGAHRGANIDRPTPARLVGGAPQGHAAQAHNLKATFLEFAYLVRLLEFRTTSSMADL